MDDSRDELQRLRRCLRDVVAFSALPSVWTGFDTPQIAAQLCEVAGGALHADVVYVRVANQENTWAAPGNGAEVDAIRHEAGGPLRTEARVPVHDHELRILAHALSFDGTDRIVVGSQRREFPDDRDRLLLRVAANQASTWIQRKNAEQALALESAFRRGIENSMAAGVAAVDLSGRQTYVNRAFASMVGLDAIDLVGAMPPFVYWAPEDYHRINAALREVIADRLPAHGFDLRFRRQNDERFDAQVLVSPLEEGARRVGYVACVYDVTHQRAQQRASTFLAEASEILSRSLNYEHTLTSVSELAVPRLADWCFVDLAEAGGWSRRIAVAHSDPADAPLARRFKRRYAPTATADGVSQTFSRGHTIVMNDVPASFLEAIARDEDHREAMAMLAMRCFVSVPMMSRGVAFGVITFAGTKAKHRFEPGDVELFEELGRRAAVAVDNARLFTEAQEANRAKDEFLTNVSHELRTPMTAILGWAHLLHQTDVDAEDVRLGISTIRQSAQSQAKLIDDLLDVSRIISGKLQLNMTATDISEVANKAAAAIRPAAAAKRQELTLDIREAPVVVIGDGARLQQVLWNLLTNAVKFTPPGGSITMTVDGSVEEVVVRVRDTGEGIAAEYLPRVFDRFRQLSTQSRTGLGIGLAIAKELVELHGGSIRAESDGEGRGAKFTVTLPAAPSGAQLRTPRRDRDELRLSGVRVLVVEDDDTTRTVMVTLLRSFGAEVCDAQSVSEALSVVHSFAPQIVLTDIAMPGDDGLSLLQKLRSVNFTAPTIAITAYADPLSRQRILAAGFDAFLSKPIDPSAFAHIIESTLRARQPEPE